MTKTRTFFNRILQIIPVSGEWVVVWADGHGGVEFDPVAAWALVMEWSVRDDVPDAAFEVAAENPPEGAERCVIPLTAGQNTPLCDKTSFAAQYSYDIECALVTARRDAITDADLDALKKRSI